MRDDATGDVEAQGGLHVHRAAEGEQRRDAHRGVAVLETQHQEACGLIIINNSNVLIIMIIIIINSNSNICFILVVRRQGVGLVVAPRQPPQGLKGVAEAPTVASEEAARVIVRQHEQVSYEEFTRLAKSWLRQA